MGGGYGAVFDVRLRGRIININSDYCFHCGDDGNSCKALCECIVVAVVNPPMDKLLFVCSVCDIHTSTFLRCRDRESPFYLK